MMLSFIIAGLVCAVAALCYAEIAVDGPGLGLGLYLQLCGRWANCLAWMVGWALVLEYAVAAGAVSVGWSGYFVGRSCNELPGDTILPAIAQRRAARARRRRGGGLINLPAFVIALLVTWLLVIGTQRKRHGQRRAGRDQGRPR